MNHTTVRRRTAWVACVLCLGAASYAQGIYWETASSGGPMGDRAVMTKTYVAPKKVKTVTADGGRSYILRLDKEVAYLVNPTNKTYSEVTFAQLEEGAKKGNAKMDERMAEMRKQLEDMPEDQRKMVEQMMGGRMGMMKKETSFDVAKTSDRRKIQGYTCTKFHVTEDGKEFMSIWASKDVREFEPLRKDFESFSQRMATMQGGITPKGLAAAMQKVDGFPFEIEMENGMKQTVTKIEKRAIPDGEFEIPAGYKKEEMKMFDADEQ
jgi:hypothetical protein